MIGILLCIDGGSNLLDRFRDILLFLGYSLALLLAFFFAFCLHLGVFSLRCFTMGVLEYQLVHSGSLGTIVIVWIFYHLLMHNTCRMNVLLTTLSN